MLAAFLLAYGSFCGVERWAVKTMRDPDAAKVQLAPIVSSIQALSKLRRRGRGQGKRRSVEETNVVTIEGYVVHVTHQADRDLHVVLADDNGYTMIAEFPDPVCMGGSPVLAQATDARQRMQQLVGRRRVRGQLKVRITGVLLFDKYHRQTGVAGNAVELHPVLAVERIGRGASRRSTER